VAQGSPVNLQQFEPDAILKVLGGGMSKEYTMAR
jgi:hypothetical protein